ncbi:MAG: flavin reductase, partial [Rhodothermales bacterium]
MKEDDSTRDRLVSLDVAKDFWSRFHVVAPLVVIGTIEGDGYDLAPKHMVTPLGWGPFFGFVCTPRHATYRNAKETGFFTVTFPNPSHVVLASITAQPRCGDGGEKPGLDDVPTFHATEIDGVFLEEG